MNHQNISGQKKVITVLYQNAGGATVYNAQASRADKPASPESGRN